MRAPGLTAAVAALLASAPVIAGPIETGSLIPRICKPLNGGPPLAAGETYKGRLARFMLSDLGLAPDVPEKDTKDYPSAAARADAAAILSVQAVMDRDRRAALSKDEASVREVVAQLQDELASEDPAVFGLRAAPLGPGRILPWLFNQDVTLECVAIAETDPEKPTFPPALRLRQTSEDLSATDADRKAAGAALIGLKHERTRNADGSRSSVSTVSIKGVLGYAISEGDESGALVFAGYELERSRAKPAPTLPPGERQSDSDTDLLEVGATGHELISGEQVSLFLTASASALFDGVKDSERVRLKVAAVPSFGDWGLGPLCRFGRLGKLVDFGLFRYRGKCTLTGLWQVNHFLDKGRATPGTADELVLAGGRFSFDMLPEGESGFVSGISYQYQQALHGNVPSVDQLNAYLKYRYWTRQDVGIDFGFDYVRGVDPDSFVNEDRLVLSLGFIF